MVNSRLAWYPERHMVVTEYQSGFRRRRPTVDNLVTLETSMRDAFVGRKHLVSIIFFFIWRRLMILPGRLPMFICDFYLTLVTLGCLAASSSQSGHHGVSAISNNLHDPGCY